MRIQTTVRTPSPSWFLWIDTARPGWMNMAIDQTLLERASAGERWLRLYGWKPTIFQSFAGS